jgi:hypothetical protein
MLENKYHERLALKNRKGHVALQIYNVSLGKKVTNLKRKEVTTTTTTIFIRLYKTALMIISNYQFWVLPKEEDKPARIMLP